MELVILSQKIFPQNGRKLELVENKIRNIFIQCLVVFWYLIKQLFHSRLLEYELMIVDKVLPAAI